MKIESELDHHHQFLAAGYCAVLSLIPLTPVYTQGSGTIVIYMGPYFIEVTCVVLYSALTYLQCSNVAPYGRHCSSTCVGVVPRAFGDCFICGHTVS